MNDNERRSITITLYIFLSMAMLASVGILISGLATTAGYAPTTQRTALLAMGLCLLLLGLTRARQFWVPRLALPMLSYLIATYLVLINFGVRDTTVSLFPVSIALAGLLLGRAGLVTFALLSVTTLFGVGYAEYSGQLVTPFSQYTSIITVVTAPLLLALTSLMIYLMADYLQRSLAQTRQNEKTLTQQNQQLESYRNTLETQVAERTRAAETARQQAEDAMQALENEIWLSKGVLPLNKTLGGEQDAQTLATQAIQVVCDVLQAPVGALYLLNVNGLELAGTFALLRREGLSTSLRLGEGIAGQAALEHKPVILRNLTAGNLTITSGLGDSAPSVIAAWPIVYAETLIGVMELGFLDEMPAQYSPLLDRATEMIAVALHTAQSRQRINALLAETQFQSLELQTRQEELRAINEELELQAERQRATQGMGGGR
jgi:hypothetical protein